MDLDILVWFVAALAFLKAIVDSASKTLEAAAADKRDRAAVSGDVDDEPAAELAHAAKEDNADGKRQHEADGSNTWGSKTFETRKEDIERWGMRLGVLGGGLATIGASGRLLVRPDLPFSFLLGIFGIAYVLVLIFMAYLSNFLIRGTPRSTKNKPCSSKRQR